MEKIFDRTECRSINVGEAAAIFGVGKTKMYNLANEAAINGGKPFAVKKFKGKLLISKKSFFAYLDTLGF